MIDPAPLADTHCHLSLGAFQADVAAVVERARRAGVRRILVPGIDLETSRGALRLAETYPEILAAVGVHPHSASEYTSLVRDELESLCESPRVVAVGEIGLDFYRDRSPRKDQLEAFEDQLRLAAAVGLPVVIHQRQAAQALLERLLPWADGRERPGVLHAFSGEAEVAEPAVGAGFFLGLAGPLTFPKSGGLRSAAASLPADRIVVETDSPYLAPHPRRGERNEPAHVALVADALAEARTLEPELARRTLWENAEALFRWSHGANDRHLL